MHKNTMVHAMNNQHSQQGQSLSMAATKIARVHCMDTMLHAMNRKFCTWQGHTGYCSCHEPLVINGKDKCCSWQLQICLVFMAWTHASCHDPNVLNMVGTKLILFMPRTNRHSLQGQLLFMAATKDVSCLWHGHDASCHEFPPRPPCSLLAIAVVTEKHCPSRFRRNLSLSLTEPTSVPGAGLLL